MPWIEITEDLYRQKANLSDPEVSALNTTALVEDQEPPIVSVIKEVVDEIKGYVRKQTTPGAGQTVPESLLGTTWAMVRYRFATRLPIQGHLILTEERVDEYKVALRKLDDVASGKFVLEEAEEKSNEPFSHPKPNIQPKHLRFRRSEDGI